MFLVLLLLGCKPDDPAAQDGLTAPELPAWGALYPAPNVDDDDGDGREDWSQAGAAGEDDLLDFTVPAQDLEGGYSYKLSTEGPIRLWLDGAPVIGDGAPYGGWVLVAGDPETTFGLEAGDYLASASITVELQLDGEPVEATTVPVLSAPLILNHHLQPGVSAWAMAIDVRWGDNNDMIADLSAALGDRFTAISDMTYDFDVWVQDEVEFATLTAGDGHRVDVVIDSIRDGQWRPGFGLDDFPEDHLEGPNFAVQTWGTEGTQTSQDSFGNLEVSPPVTVDGVHYPFGRIYWGDAGGRWQIDDKMAAFLRSQKIQEPFVLDTSWLCVGHVDEWMSFLPDPDAPKGFWLIYSDTELGRAFLEGLDPALELPRYDSGHGYATAGAIQDDQALELLNEELQADYLEPNLEIMKAELGLTEDDIIRVPAYFEEVRGCGGATVALIPGTANYQLYTWEDGTTDVFLPDPFLRDPSQESSTDPFVAEFEGLLPGGGDHAYRWLDDWDIYHMGLGEVHCGSNVVRQPIDDWWEVGLHLLE